VGAGLHASLEEAAAAMIGGTRRFEPVMDNEERAVRLAAWDKALSAL
jgi:glycerol kinase